MPIEIRELHIRVAVDAGKAGAEGKPAGAPGPSDAGGSSDHDAIVAECVAQVLQILKERKER